MGKNLNYIFWEKDKWIIYGKLIINRLLKFFVRNGYIILYFYIIFIIFLLEKLNDIEVLVLMCN